VNAPEDVEDVFVGNHVRIKCDLGHFGMSGAAGANLLVSGTINVAAGIARNDTLNTFHVLIDCLNTPKASAAEGCGLKLSPIHGFKFSSVFASNWCEVSQVMIQ
jgi:hypothetical protein